MNILLELLSECFNQELQSESPEEVFQSLKHKLYSTGGTAEPGQMSDGSATGDRLGPDLVGQAWVN
jgi:hypothetical protein